MNLNWNYFSVEALVLGIQVERERESERGSECDAQIERESGIERERESECGAKRER